MADISKESLQNYIELKRANETIDILKSNLSKANMSNHVLKSQNESMMKKEINKRTKQIYEELSKENKILELRALTAEDAEARLTKKNRQLEKQVSKLENEQAELKKEIEELKLKVQRKEISEKELFQKIKELENKLERTQSILNLDGTNAGIPTSQTPINKNKVRPNSRIKSNKKIGGQIGHQKHKLEKFKEEEITKRYRETLKVCEHCHSHDLEETGKIETRDEYQYRIKLDKIRHEYIEYRCKCCGKIVRKEIPKHLMADNQYGNSIQTTASALMNIGNVPINKVKRIIEGLTMNEVSLSEGYISKLQRKASKNLERFISELKKEIAQLKLVHWDDTVIMINTKRACMRFYGNDNLALYTAHMHKDKAGLDIDNILNVLTKTQNVMHDHNMINYNSKYDFMNLECNVHLLRDLEKVNINLPERTWSRKLKEHIQEYDHLRNEYIDKNQESFNEDEINNYFIKLDEYLLLGYEENEKDSNSYYADKEKTLLDRIIEYRDNYTYWVLDFDLPFSNNSSERALRGIKSKMKISGQFQNIANAEYYANIRSYIETCHRNGINEFEALKRLFIGNPFTIDEIVSYEKN